MRGRKRDRLPVRAALYIALTTVCLGTALLPRTSFAQAGSLDPTFGVNGTVLTDLPNSEAEALALQGDGKIIAAGRSEISSGRLGFALARYMPDGSLDGTFGTGGRVTTPLGYSATPLSVLVQPDGKIVAAGRTRATDRGTSDFGLVRYNPDGSVDATFGTNGLIITDFAGRNDIANSVLLQPDGKIIAAGSTENPQRSFGLARYLPDGTLDGTFGTGGLVTTHFVDWSEAFSVLLQPDGHIVAVGRSLDKFALARYLSDGSLDVTYGTGGLVTTGFGQDRWAGASSAAMQSDGEIIAAGSVTPGLSSTSDFALARYHSNGTLDASFGTGGRLTTAFHRRSSIIWSIAIQENDKIVALGSASNRVRGISMALARYLPDGIPDTAFGKNGRVTTNFGSFALGNAVVLQADGKIVGGGISGVPNKFAIARYLGDPVTTVKSCPNAYPDLLITDFDPSQNEFVEFQNVGSLPVDLGGCYAATWNANTETVIWVGALAGVVLAGETYTIANASGDYTLPASSMPDGPGALAVVGRPIAVGGSIQDALGAIVSSIVYVDASTVYAQDPALQPEKSGSQAEFDDALASVAAALPEAFALEQNYPNPFNPTTEIRFTMPAAGHVQLVVYDIVGREVVRLLDGPLPAGTHAIPWHAENVPSGAYVYRIISAGFAASRTMLLLK